MTIHVEDAVPKQCNVMLMIIVAVRNREKINQLWERETMNEGVFHVGCVPYYLTHSEKFGNSVGRTKLEMEIKEVNRKR